MTEVVCVHIGLPKTGSSAVQAFFDSKAEALARRGVYYAQNAHTRTDSGIASSGNGRALLKYLDVRRRPANFDEAKFARVLQKVYFSAAFRTSLISSELLASVDWKMLPLLRDNVLDGREVRIVAVVRNLYDHALSSWNQAVKWHAYTEGFEHYARHDYANPQLKSLSYYAACFGWDAMHLVQYEQSRDDLIGAVLKPVGVTAKPGWTAPRTNRSLTRPELHVQRLLNRVHHDRDLAKETAERFIASRPAAHGPPPWRPDIAQMLADRFGPAVEQLGRGIGQDLQGIICARPRRSIPVSPFEYIRLARAALPVARKALKARLAAVPTLESKPPRNVKGD